MAQLRIDRARLVRGQPVLEYTHTEALLPSQPSGIGSVWDSVEEMLTQARTLRAYLAQPEQLVLLHVLAAFDVDLSTPDATTATAALATLPGKIVVAPTGRP